MANGMGLYKLPGGISMSYSYKPICRVTFIIMLPHCIVKKRGIEDGRGKERNLLSMQEA